MMYFTYDREGSDANGNLVFIPSGSYRSWEEGGYSWAQGSAPNNTEFEPIPKCKIVVWHQKKVKKLSGLA